MPESENNNIVDPQEPLQHGHEIVAGNTPTRRRKPIILLLILVVLLFAVIGGYTIFRANGGEGTTSNTSNQSAQSKQGNDHANSTLAYLANGKVQLINPTSNKTESFNVGEGTLTKLYGWSPNNKHILYKVSTDDESQVKYYVLDVTTGKKTLLNMPADRFYAVEPSDAVSNFVWVSNSSIRYVATDGVHEVALTGDNKLVTELPISDFKSSELLEQFNLSPDGNKVAYTGLVRRETAGNPDYTGPNYPVPSNKLLVVDTLTKKLMNQEQKIDRIHGWAGTKVMVEYDNAFYFIDSKKNIAEKIVAFTSDGTGPSAIAATKEQELVAYSNRVDSKTRILSLVNLKSKKTTSLMDLRLGETDQEISSLSFSPDQKTLSYAISTVVSGSLYMTANSIELSTGKNVRLCEGGYVGGNFAGYCDSPIWQHASK